jgi:hypothetical protein
MLAVANGLEHQRARDAVAADQFDDDVDVREIAKDRGIDMNRVQAAAGTMSNSQIGEVASLVAAVAPAQDGGGMGSVTISVAAVIIILLILILVT